MKNTGSIAVAALSLVCYAASAQTTQGDTQKSDLGSLGIEDLMKIEVTTASKQAQSLAKVPAAVYVVTQEDIRRSGATSIPEALRMVPGVQVQQVYGDQWLVSIRGFDIRFADKLLVMIDGRSIYDPLFAGVFWDMPEISMDDIDRIEIIRGPGGTLWGANAVNGIINIITKKASDSQGSQVSASTSSASTQSLELENGGKLGPRGSYRANLKIIDGYSLPSSGGGQTDDDWQSIRGSFRTDWSTTADSYTVSGGANNSHEGQTSLFPTLTAPYTQVENERFPISNWDVVTRWERTSGWDKGISVQASLDHIDRTMPEAIEKRDTFRIDLQQPLATSGRNRIVWGLGYTGTRDDTGITQLTSITPASKVDQVFSGFLQDELKLSESLQLSLGAKLEHNDYSGWEVQPSGRIAWTKNSKETFWAAVSRAVRTPTRVSDGVTAVTDVIPPEGGSLPILVEAVGNPNFKSERLIANEIGWRYLPSDRLSLDLTAFYNHYNGLYTLEPLAGFFDPNPIPHWVQPMQYGNGLNAETAGFEAASQYQAAANWRLKSSFTFFTGRFYLDHDSQDSNSSPEIERQGSTPPYQLSLSSSVDLSRALQWDTEFYYVDKIQLNSIPAYGRVDMRIGWRPSSSVECSLGVQNLMTLRHREAIDSFVDIPDIIERNFYLTATFHF